MKKIQLIGLMLLTMSLTTNVMAQKKEKAKKPKKEKLIPRGNLNQRGWRI